MTRYTIGDMPAHEDSGADRTRVAETGVISARPFLADNAWHVEHIFRDGRVVDWNTVQDRPAVPASLAESRIAHVNPYGTKSGENHG